MFKVNQDLITFFHLLRSDSSDIVDCKLKLILGLIWTLILHYSISMPMWDGEEEHQRGSGPTPKQRQHSSRVLPKSWLTFFSYVIADLWAGFRVKCPIYPSTISPMTGTTVVLLVLWLTELHQVIDAHQKGSIRLY